MRYVSAVAGGILPEEPPATAFSAAAVRGVPIRAEKSEYSAQFGSYKSLTLYFLFLSKFTLLAQNHAPSAELSVWGIFASTGVSVQKYMNKSNEIFVGFLSVVLPLAVSGCDAAAMQKEQQRRADAFLDDVHAKVASDAVVQYEIAKRNGTPIDRAVHAGIVAAAYLQAKDETNYAKWKAIEKADTEAANSP